MALMRMDRRTVSRAAPGAVLRLARYIGVPLSDDCTCPRCNARLVDEVVRRIDRDESTWPPRLTERRW